MLTSTVVSTGRWYPIDSSQTGVWLPRPPASTTRSASNLSLDSVPSEPRSSTPVMRDLSGDERNPVTVHFSRILISVSALSRRSKLDSRNGRLCQYDTKSEAGLAFQTPPWYQQRSFAKSQTTDPVLASSSKKPGKSRLMTRTPPPKMTWTFFPWGTPLRGS